MLRAYQYFLENLNGSQPAQHQALKRQTATHAVNLIKNIYETAGIPTISDERIRKQFWKLTADYKDYNKVSFPLLSMEIS